MKQLLREEKKETSVFQKIKLIKKEHLLLSLIIGAFLLLFIGSIQIGIFKIKDIHCKTQYRDCSQEDYRVFDEFKNKSLLLVSPTEVQKRGEQNTSNKKVIVERVFPGTLSIVLEKRNPVIALTSQDPRTPMVFVDQGGTVVDIGTQTNLPTITVNRSMKEIYLGEKLEQPVTHSVQTMYLSFKAWGVNRGELDQDSLKITLSDGTQVLFALDRDPQALVGALQLIETRSRIDGKLPKLIDLRYIRPVLTY